MLEIILKQLGIKPDELKKQIADGGLLIKTIADTLQRIEHKIDVMMKANGIHDKQNDTISITQEIP